MPDFATKELSTKTWPDFERLFSQGNGWDFCWCTAYQRGASGGQKASGLKLEKVPRNRAEWNEVNHRVKRDLVEDGRGPRDPGVRGRGAGRLVPVRPGRGAADR